ncbi:MAG: hypothetical protein CHACPFDD_02850 [Phycisphaerae bacterium]|nr:hypothetical protein [Phycisphaerae bacterium]
MPLTLIYLYQNAIRNPMRTSLTCAAVALPIMIFVLSVAVIDGIERFLDNSARQLRLVVSSRVSIVTQLPSAHRTRIESLDPQKTRLRGVCGVRWIGGKVERDPRPLSTLAVDEDAFYVAFPDTGMTPEENEAWARDRQAIALGRGTAKQFGWKVGDRITISPSVPPYTPMEFHVVTTLENGADPITNWCRRDYLEEELKRVRYPADRVSFYFVKCGSKADLDALHVEIADLLNTSADPVSVQDEKAFMNQFITQNFDLPRNLTILAAVTVFVAIMAAANTMSMNFRDRINEFATLKALGFGGGFVSRLMQIESLGVCLLGGLLGAGGPYVAFTHTPLANVTIPVIQYLDIRPAVCGQALLIALGIGLLAALWPAVAAMRMRVVAALRNLE